MPGKGRRSNRTAATNRGRIHLTAATADRHLLYEAAVQNVDFELDVLEGIFRRKRARRLRSLREDFCGTATLACKWVKRSRLNTAIGVDLHRPTLDWGIRNHASSMGAACDRLTLLCKDVRSVRSPKVDVLVAFNYSYSVFKSREQLREYFRIARQSLKRDGIFVVDAFGGTDATIELEEDRKVDGFAAPDGRRVPSFKYVWEQVRFNPINHDILCRIHFEFRDGTRLNNAFRYDWRFWTLPELQEIMREAGFRSAEVYVEGWDDDADEANGIFRRRSRIEEMAGWVGYVLGLK